MQLYDTTRFADMYKWLRATGQLSQHTLEGRLRQLFCRHSFRLSRWHWYADLSVSDYPIIECEVECSECGKRSYRDIIDDWDNLNAWADFHKEQEWQITYDN